jgi:hypothetical protein
MSVPPEMMRAMMSRQQPPSAPQQMPQGAVPPEMGQEPPAVPASAPMSTPSQPEGQRMAAMAQIGNAIDLMEQTLPKIGADTPEGQSVMQAMQTLNETFGRYRSRLKELQPAQIMQMLRALPTQMRGQPSGPEIS